MLEKGAVLRTGDDALGLLAPRLAGLSGERLTVAFLDDGFRLLGVIDHPMEPATCEARRIAFPVRHIVLKALVIEAAGMILAHNHPSGDPTPSPADLAATRVLADTVRGLRIRLLDHLVIAGERCASFREQGLL